MKKKQKESRGDAGTWFSQSPRLLTKLSAAAVENVSRTVPTAKDLPIPLLLLDLSPCTETLPIPLISSQSQSHLFPEQEEIEHEF